MAARRIHAPVSYKQHKMKNFTDVFKKIGGSGNEIILMSSIKKVTHMYTYLPRGGFCLER